MDILINNIKNIVTNETQIDIIIDKVRGLLNNDLMSTMKWISPTMEHRRVYHQDVYYEKIFMYDDDDFSIVLIKWKKGSVTKIHDHPSKGCVAKLLKGKIKEESYDNDGGKIKFSESKIVNENDIFIKIGSDTVHRIVALDDAISLHVYIPGHYVPNIYVCQ